MIIINKNRNLKEAIDKLTNVIFKDLIKVLKNNPSEKDLKILLTEILNNIDLTRIK